jgi:hypothetical protein
MAAFVLLTHANNKHAIAVRSKARERRVQGGILGARRQGRLAEQEEHSPALRLIYARASYGKGPFKNLILGGGESAGPNELTWKPVGWMRCRAWLIARRLPPRASHYFCITR